MARSLTPPGKTSDNVVRFTRFGVSAMFFFSSDASVVEIAALGGLGSVGRLDFARSPIDYRVERLTWKTSANQFMLPQPRCSLGELITAPMKSRSLSPKSGRFQFGDVWLSVGNMCQISSIGSGQITLVENAEFV
jgi:hypothetical protein